MDDKSPPRSGLIDGPTPREGARSKLYEALRRRRINSSRNRFGRLKSEMDESQLVEESFEPNQKLSLRGY